MFQVALQAPSWKAKAVDAPDWVAYSCKASAQDRPVYLSVATPREHILRAHSRMGRSSFGGMSSREEMSFAQNL